MAHLLRLFLVWVFLTPLLVHLHAKSKAVEPTKRLDDYSMTTGKTVEIRARKANYPVYVYGDQTKGLDSYTPSGLMGDNKSLKKITSSYDMTAPASTGRFSRTSLKLVYKAKGRQGWAGLYWLTPANNWGNRKGAGFNLTNAKRLTFWIRGEKGGEKIAEVKVGGVNGNYPDTDSISLGPLKLSREWEQYTIDLKGADLRHIVGGFAIIFRRADNPKGAVVYLDEIIFKDTEKDDEVDISTKVVSVPVVEEKKEPDVPKLEEPIRRVILFSYGGKKMGPKDESNLKEFIEFAHQYPNSKIILEGHSDSVGAAEFNLRLSKKRAEAVGGYIEEAGINKERITVVGFGEEKPIATNKTKEGRHKNRRVVAVLSTETD